MEGDLVVLINGRDISEHTHDQVVMFIRASRESHSRELSLLIRRKGVCVRVCLCATQTSFWLIVVLEYEDARTGLVFQVLAVLRLCCSCLPP